MKRLEELARENERLSIELWRLKEEKAAEVTKRVDETVDIIYGKYKSLKEEHIKNKADYFTQLLEQIKQFEKGKNQLTAIPIHSSNIFARERLEPVTRYDVMRLALDICKGKFFHEVY